MGELCRVADRVDEVDDPFANPEGDYGHHRIVDDHDNTRGAVYVYDLEAGTERR